MKSTGMVRGIDKMGRVVLPTETRKLLNLVAGKSAVEIYTDDDSIVLKKICSGVYFLR
ncbi:MAG: AbrB/MazE/SpoVT family DNA-binding domain-containing protein [Acutalibacteraceae bacterium]